MIWNLKIFNAIFVSFEKILMKYAQPSLFLLQVSPGRGLMMNQTIDTKFTQVEGFSVIVG